MTDAGLLRDARAWLADDPDPETRAELEALIEAQDLDALRNRFGKPLTFGTAGIRGVLGAGPGRMNLWTVARTTAGVCRDLLDDLDSASERGLCIGFDGRHHSRRFADEVAAVATGAGLRTYLFDHPVPTPLLAFAVRQLGAAGGVMITASHNPPQYNGYKVYGPDAAQIVAPRDARITEAIADSGSVLTLPRTSPDEARASGRLTTLDDSMDRTYLAALPADTAAPGGGVGIAYTALHGVGESLLMRALAQAGFEHIESVAAQARPDPDFPTVAFPNPEEPGAMDLVLQLAERTDATLALANDPDADRLAVAARLPDGAMAAFSGDQLGMLLADFALERAPDRGTRNLVLRSIVSSTMLESIAAHHGATAVTTLTGFKWILQRALELEATTGASMVFGFEEAIGYSFGEPTRDKDGIHAAVLVAQLAQACADAGLTLWDRMEALYDRHGHHVTAQYSARYPDSADGRKRIDGVMASLRADAPTSLAGRAVIACTDLLASDVDLPPTDLVILELDGGHRICVRPSGTEPKIKLYFECVSQLAGTAGHGEATQVLTEIREATLLLLGL